MNRTINRLAIIGAAMLTLGAAMIFTAQSTLPMWITWVLGPLCWYFGFAMVVVWGLYRVFGRRMEETADEEEESHVEQRPSNLRYFPSNFLEHDFESGSEGDIRRASVKA